MGRLYSVHAAYHTTQHIWQISKSIPPQICQYVKVSLLRFSRASLNPYWFFYCIANFYLARWLVLVLGYAT